MISLVDAAAAQAGARTYQLKIVLAGTRPPVWRRLQVPGAASLGWLHAAIQVAMGWTNSHLHQFRIGEKVYSQTGDFQDAPQMLDENRFTLQQLAPRAKATIEYEYDFGDSWWHTITVEKILSPAAKAATTAVCLKGARACPPEDCGGVWGYENLVAALADPKHPEHASLKEWVGGKLDPEKFNAAETNRWLARLKWPRVTEGQLRKVLMARDGYSE